MLKLPFFDSPTEIARRLESLGPVSLLDSGGSERGRWDVVAAAPTETITLDGHASDAEIEIFIERLLKLETAIEAQGLQGGDAGEALPFHGGLVGFLSYELGRRLQGLNPSAGAEQALAVVRHYPWAIVQDRQRGRSHLVGEPAEEQLADQIASLLTGRAEARSQFSLNSAFRGAWSYSDYALRFARVKEYILAGDCYQINLGQPFRAPYTGDLLEAYELLRNLARAPFSACFPLAGDKTLLSFSPERFLSVDAGRVRTHPIKGTRPRAEDPAADRALAAELEASAKERAENLMIVDLLRNDIGRHCVAGSVEVERLFALESFATVHHLVSQVAGTLRPDTTPLQLLLGCMPGGSITGAPKYRAMQLIDELESAPRESWCGTLFSRSAGEKLDSNILIRTLYGDGAELTCWAGGGLVADSRVEEEYQELEHKVGAFLEALKRM